jgi:hypothetical protein
LYSCQHCPGASPDKQVIVANERKASFNRSCFAYFDDSVWLGEVSELWSNARANAGNASFGGLTAECDRAYRLDRRQL